jgi:hypothetical protein
MVVSRRKRVTRGLLMTADRHTPFRPTKTALEKTDRTMRLLEAAPLGAYAWREVWQTFKRYASGSHDLYGRRLMEEKALTKARYVARVCYRAWKGKALPQGRGWGNLRSAMLTVFKRLD